MMWIRGNALAAAALLSFLSTGAVRAQTNPLHTQSMMQHHQMMNQMDMMQRSQTLQAMSRAREARRAKQARAKCQSSAQGATGNKCKAASGKSKAPAKRK